MNAETTDPTENQVYSTIASAEAPDNQIDYLLERAKTALLDIGYCAGAYTALRATTDIRAKAFFAISVAICGMKIASDVMPNDRAHQALRDIAVLMDPWGKFGLFLTVFTDPKDALHNAKSGAAIGGLIKLGEKLSKDPSKDMTVEMVKWFESYKEQLKELQEKIENLANNEQSGSGSSHEDNSIRDGNEHSSQGDGRHTDDPKSTKPGSGELSPGDGSGESYYA